MPAHSVGSSAVYRIHQGLTALWPFAPAPDDALLARWLNPAERRLFRVMTRHDQRHSAHLARRLLDGGATDRDLIAAALLHDVGKAGSATAPGRVRLTDRVARVLLRRWAPDTLARFNRSPRSRPLRGLYLAEHHAAVGAEVAGAAGASPRTVWLIAHHDDRAAAARDPELRGLHLADDQTI